MSVLSRAKTCASGLTLLCAAAACQDSPSAAREPPLPGIPSVAPGIDTIQAGVGGIITNVAGSGSFTTSCTGNAGNGPFLSSAPPPVGRPISGVPVMPGMLSLVAVSADKAPPPISGGTLLTTRDGTLLIAADSDRDQVYFIDIASNTLLFAQPLQAGDEPGRLVEDAAGRVHVALRGAGAVATLTRNQTDPVTRRAVCDLPRGIAYDSSQDALQVACAEGKLITLAAAPSGGVVRSINVGVDARDVIVRGPQLFISYFRSSQLIGFDAAGNALQRYAPPTVTQTESTFSSDAGACLVQQDIKVNNQPTIAWRAIDVPGHGVAMLHQRARDAEVQVTQGGYGASAGCAPGIVHSALTVGIEGTQQYSVDLPNLAVAVDVASDPDGVLLATVAPGNWGTSPQVEVYRITDINAASSSVNVDPNIDAGVGFVPSGFGPAGAGACMGTSLPIGSMTAQATAVSFASPYILAVQEREPAGITFIDVRTGETRPHLDLKQASRFDTGHALFHMRAGAGLACASCHAEGGDDSHVWTFHGIGARRTQQLRGGILGTEPFHWNGDMQDFPTLVQEVFVGRMAGFQPETDQTSALASWIDRQPEFKVSASDPAASARGKSLFESDAVGCNGCHSGPHLTNNQTVDVGTGAALQVPSLHDVGLRAPLMHDGCAKSLADRFSDAACGGGDKHGHTSQLSAAQVSDLIAYVSTL
jgi:hypothetical protein